VPRTTQAGNADGVRVLNLPSHVPFFFLVNCYFKMAISTDLLEILICPACRAKVELKPDGSGLRCLSCHRLYPVRDDIPVMLVDEATIDE